MVAKNEVAIANSLKNIRLSDSEGLDNEPTRADNLLRDLISEQSFRHTSYFSACCLKDMKQLEAFFRKYPEDLFANAVNNKGNNGILFIITEDAKLATIKWLEKKGVFVD